MKTKKVNPSHKAAADALLGEMIIKFGVKFMSDFDDVKRGAPLYVVLLELGEEINPSPIFPSLEIAATFVELCRKHLPGFKEKNFRIYKMIAA